ncbi:MULTISPECIES: proton-conducting transporter membrane subunit [Haloferax]|uniref:Cation:proton antiporter n=1 Tax=Haloferax marinum TaxID=2666143 RepID=A0A6A8G9F2_9EURY|nr:MULTISPECIES: proton-conducting transporter membrane subunit [Haloferax]KAB1197851.1 cation:proton antiporter [Haloferax sp. CBA1150]MRW96913.1 cation:proton antiporter [Haloferax marinum]
MTEFLTLAPPWVAFVLALLVVAVTPRAVGTAVGVVLVGLTIPWMWAIDAGSYLVVSPFGFEQVLFTVDEVTRPVVILFGFIAAVNLAYGYATDADSRQQLYALSYMGAGVVAVLAGDWLTLLVGWELLAVTATVLVWHHGGDAVRPAFRYAIYHLVGGAFLVAAVAFHFATTGSFVYDGGLAGGLPRTLALVGVGVNLGFIGLHFWLPETYPRPHVAASVVLAAFTTKVAVVVLYRVAPDGAVLVAWLGGIMIVYGVTQAIFQTDMRRLLSYHIVSQVGYMVVALGIGTAAGVSGSFAHLVAHVLYKGLLFMVAGVLIYRTGKRSLKHLGGLARVMPVTFVAFLVAALAITGAPGFSGFVSKGLITKAVESTGETVLWWMLVVGSVGTVLSFAKFGYYAFVRTAPDDLDVRPTSLTLRAVLIAIAIPSVVFGIFPEALLGSMPGDAGGFDAYATSELLKAGAVLAIGILGFVVFRTRLARIHLVDVDRVLYPLAVRGTTALSVGAVATSDAASHAAASLVERTASLVGAEPRLSDTIQSALVLLFATVGFALSVVLLTPY